MGARFYWPELGRFIQQDPIRDDINSYAYAANNPLAYADPSGEVLWDLADIGIFVADVAACAKDPSWQNVTWAVVSGIGALPAVPNVVGYVRAGAKGIKVAAKGAKALRAYGRGKKAVAAAKAANKGAKGLDKIVGHHLLPNEFKEEFAKAGIKNLDDYLIPLTQRRHNSIMGKGVHTGPNHWNKQWGQFLKQTEKPTRDDILRQLEKMRKEFCI